MTTQPKALRLAEILKEDALLTVSHSEIAYELERQHAETERLQSQLKAAQCEAKMLHEETNAKHAEIERLTAALYAATNPPFTGKADTWQAACGKARSERDEARAQIERLEAVNAGLVKSLRMIQWSNDSKWQADCAKEAISKAEQK